MKLLAYDSKKLKYVLVGHIVKNVLIKKVDPKVHFMKVVDGYGIQYASFLDLPIKKVKKIRIIEEGGSEWDAPVKTWKEHGKIADYGNGKQIFLSLKFMKKHTPAPVQENAQISILGMLASDKDAWEKLGKKLHSK